MTTPLYPTFRKRVDDAFEQLIKQQVTPWSFLTAGPPFRINAFDGREIAYQHLNFEGSPSDEFWSRYIEPFLEHLCISEIETAVFMSSKKGVDAKLLLPELRELLSAGFKKVYRQMADVDRRLRGKGYPNSVALRSVESEIQRMDNFLDERIMAEIEMWKPTPWLEAGFQYEGLRMEEHSRDRAGTTVDTDATGVLSKKQYLIDMPHILVEATESDLPLAILFLDIDEFKKVNEQVGHDGGDDVLKLIASKAAKSVGIKGKVYRYGGDEFVVLLSNHSLEEAAAVADRLHSECSKLQYPKKIPVTVTIGVSAWPMPVKDIQSLLKSADDLLLEGKKKGQRNKVHIASSTKTDIISADEWRLTLTLSPETELVIPKYQLLDYLLNSCCSLPLHEFGRRYRFPLDLNRNNLIQETEEGWIGARIESPWAQTSTYQIANNGSARLIITQRHTETFRAVKVEAVLFETIRFWPFVTRFWKQALPQMHFLSISLEGLVGAFLSLDVNVYRAENLISKLEKYESQDVPFLPASGAEGLNDLLLHTCHNIVAAFVPPQGVSKSDLRLQYFQGKAASFLEDVHDPETTDE
jgi:diguanylate cyclase (GGDEF)-like protein